MSDSELDNQIMAERSLFVYPDFPFPKFRSADCRSRSLGSLEEIECLQFEIARASTVLLTEGLGLTHLQEAFKIWQDLLSRIWRKEAIVLRLKIKVL